MRHDVMKRFDSVEIGGVQGMLTTRPVDGLPVEIFGKHLYDSIQNRHAGYAETGAFFDQRLARPAADQGKNYRARVFPDALDHQFHLGGRKNHRPDMFLRVDVLKLRNTGLQNPLGSLTR